MRVEEVNFRSFRSYQELSLKLLPGLNVFIGDNGQGKTNLVEGIHLLLKGDSFRPGSASSWIKENQPRALIATQVWRPVGTSRIELSIADQKRQFQIDNKKTSGEKLARVFPAVVFSPESLAAIKAGPDERRRLVDEFITTHRPMDSNLVSDFKRALRHRNQLLRQIRDSFENQDSLYQVLSALDQIYLPLAAHLAEARVRALSIIEPFLQQAVEYISDGELVDISVDYLISGNSALDWEGPQRLENITNRLKLLKNSELSAATSLVGPHKHEVMFLSHGKDARYFLSQGQQRSLILAFKMGQIMYHRQTFGVHPLLILDDVLSELDPRKSARLLEFLEGVKSQILLTTTDLALPFQFGDESSGLFKVGQGCVERLR